MLWHVWVLFHLRVVSFTAHIPSLSCSSSKASSSRSSKVWPRVFKIVRTFSFSMWPDLPESNMENARRSTANDKQFYIILSWSKCSSAHTNTGLNVTRLLTLSRLETKHTARNPHIAIWIFQGFYRPLFSIWITDRGLFSLTERLSSPDWISFCWLAKKVWNFKVFALRCMKWCKTDLIKFC